MITITRYLSPDGDVGGNNTNLENKLFEGFGGGTKTPEQIQKDAEIETKKLEESEVVTIGDDLAKEQATLESLLAKDETTLTVDEKKNLDILKTKFNLEPLKEDGTAYTKEELEQRDKLDKQIKDILAKPEDKRTVEEVAILRANTEVEKDIYAQVDELSGEPVEVDYEGVDPKTPEGIVKREDTIREQAVVNYDNQLKEEFPVPYELMVHMKAGGTLEEFFENGNEQDYNQITLTKADVKAQENIYRRALSLKGNTPEQIDTLVKYAQDKLKLFEYSQIELEQLQAKQEVQKTQRVAKAKAQEQRDNNLVDSFYKTTNTYLTSGLKGVNIPKSEHKAFNQYLQDNKFFIRDGKLLSIVEITNDNIQDEIAANYFKFKKADLSGIAQRKAESINASNIKNKVMKYKITPKNNPDGNKHYVPLNQI